MDWQQQLAALITRAGNTAIDLKVFEQTAGQGLPTWSANTQQSGVPLTPAVKSSASVGEMLEQHWPMLLLGVAAVVIVAKLAK